MKELSVRDRALISELMTQAAESLEAQAKRQGGTNVLTPKLNYWAKKIIESEENVKQQPI